MKTSLKGHLLIATPELLAPIFVKSVILMLDHSAEGAAGLILNRLTEATVASISEQVFEQPSDWLQPIRLGGPVQGPLIVIHRREEFADQTVLPGLFSTVDADNVRELMRLKVEPSLTLANYSGWGPGQLESEIAQGSWVTIPATIDFVFWNDPDDLWKAVMKSYRGRSLSTLLNLREIPSDPSLN